jgi:hypothetical protein
MVSKILCLATAVVKPGTLATIRRVNLLFCVLVGLVIVALVPHTVSAQVQCYPPPCAQVTNVSAPASVAVGQAFTITVTVTYVFWNLGEYLVIAILNQYPNGSPFPTTGAASGSCSSSGVSVYICFKENMTLGSGEITASFTLSGLNQTRMWYLWAVGMIAESPSVIDSSSAKTVGVNVTSAPIPEVTSPLLLLSLTLIATVYLVKRKQCD